MTDEEKMGWMFREAYGEMSGACYTEITYNIDGEADRIACMKGGNVCWSKSKADLVFDYLTKHLDT